MILTLDEAKQYSRIDSDIVEDDTLIEGLIDAACEELHNATEIVFDSTNPLAKLYVKVLVNDFYDNRSATEEIKIKTRLTLDSIKLQLQYCYGV